MAKHGTRIGGFITVRNITDSISFPYGASINDFIDPDSCRTAYQPFEKAVQMVASQGTGCFMAKADIKSAFRNIPMARADLHLLGIKFKGKYFVDTCLPFGASISCAIFESVASLIHWITEQRTHHEFTHYLDDFFTAHFLKFFCHNLLQSFQEVCEEIQMPLAPEKLVLPCQSIQFLGLGMDSLLMIIQVPKDKQLNILIIVKQVLLDRKSTVRNLQSLAGKFNFISKAIPYSRSFIRSLYDATKQRPQHHRIDITGTLLKDLRLWNKILTQFPGWAPIILDSDRFQNPIIVYTDAAKHKDLGWGSYETNGRWSQGQWNIDFLNTFDPSIDFLELYAIVVSVFHFAKESRNRSIICYSDNTPAVQAINKFSSPSHQLMLLIRPLALLCMNFNVTVKAKYIPGPLNKVADALSRFQMQQFQRLLPEGVKLESWTPSCLLYPLSESKLLSSQP